MAALAQGRDFGAFNARAVTKLAKKKEAKRKYLFCSGGAGTTRCEAFLIIFSAQSHVFVAYYGASVAKEEGGLDGVPSLAS